MLPWLAHATVAMARFGHGFVEGLGYEAWARVHSPVMWGSVFTTYRIKVGMCVGYGSLWSRACLWRYQHRCCCPCITFMRPQPKGECVLVSGLSCQWSSPSHPHCALSHGATCTPRTIGKHMHVVYLRRSMLSLIA